MEVDMPRCIDCKHEGSYTAHRGHCLASGQIENFMRCQEPGGGPTQNPIAETEARINQPCDYYKPKY